MSLFKSRSLVAAGCFFAFFLLFSTGAGAQEKMVPKREFRGVWLTTVANIDWPSKPGLPADQQKNELLRILDEHQQNGINAILFQVRPAADALYAKSREPWSRFLTGKQGKAPEPFYDPLEFAIAEAHKRGMELHAWINPYRASTDLLESHFSADHITKTHPNWFYTYEGRRLFNPGIPQAQDYIVQVVMDIVRNYDIDGIHFDDYFYPYKDARNTPIPDTYTFNLFKGGFTNIKDWRRQNVDTLIHRLSDSIHAVKKYVKFGMSPFGIWKNIAQDSTGSVTAGGSSYLENYADSKKWVEKGWIDYINPQIYWSIGYRAASFENLLSWWGNHAFGRHLYIGQAAYRTTENGAGWQDRSMLYKEMRMLRDNPRVQGSVFFSSKSVTNNLAGIRDSLRYDFYKYRALPPPMLWLDNVPPRPPVNLVARAAGEQISLAWMPPPPAQDGEPTYGYVIYRFNEGEEVTVQNARNIISISYDSTLTTYTDRLVRPDVRYTYAVTAIDRLKNESLQSNLSVVKIRE